MKIENISNYINHVESKYNVAEWTIDNIHLWPFIRIENNMLLGYKVLGSQPIKTRSWNFFLKLIKSKISRMCAVLFDFNKEVFIKSADFVFLSDGMSYTKLQTKWYNKLCDPIASELSSKGYTFIRFDLSYNFFIPRYSPSRFIQNNIDNIIIKSIVLSKIFTPKFVNENWSDFEDFQNDRFVIDNLIYIPSKRDLRKRIAKINRIKSFYIQKLKKINPKTGFVVNYYGDDQMAFVLACKELNIPTVDIQHGVQGALHLGYGKWTKTPSNGYCQMPNYFWVWSQKEKVNIDEWSMFINGPKAVVIGSLFSEMWKDSSSELVIDFDNKFNRIKTNKNKKSIILTLSPHTESLMNNTWEVVKLTQFEFNWFIRVHPSMVNNVSNIKNDLKNRGITQFEISQTSKLPLYTILRNVDAHITCQSSCVIEAAEFGVKSIISSEYGKSLYEDLINSHYAFYENYSKDIINKIRLIINQKGGFLNNKSNLIKDNVIDNLIINTFPKSN